MFATDAANGNRDIKDGLFERSRWMQRFTGKAVEQWANSPPGSGILVPEIECQSTLLSAEQGGTLKRGSCSIRRQGQPVPRDEQIVGMLHANHAEAHQ